MALRGAAGHDVAAPALHRVPHEGRLSAKLDQARMAAHVILCPIPRASHECPGEHGIVAKGGAIAPVLKGGRVMRASGFGTRATVILMVVLLLAAFAATSSAAGGSQLADDRAEVGGQGNPGVLPPNSSVLGKSYGEWGAEWWKWAVSIPLAINPMNDQTGANAAQGQSGSVWFLAGTFCPDLGQCNLATATRTCTRLPHLLCAGGCGGEATHMPACTSRTPRARR